VEDFREYYEVDQAEQTINIELARPPKCIEIEIRPGVAAALRSLIVAGCKRSRTLRPMPHCPTASSLCKEDQALYFARGK